LPLRVGVARVHRPPRPTLLARGAATDAPTLDPDGVTHTTALGTSVWHASSATRFPAASTCCALPT
jgi:hypothetical protein